MTYFRCLGELRNVNSKFLLSEMKVLVPEINGRARLFGFEIELETEALEIYIQSDDEELYIIDISMREEKAFFTFLEQLRNSLILLNARFDLVHFIEDVRTMKQLKT